MGIPKSQLLFDAKQVEIDAKLALLDNRLLNNQQTLETKVERLTKLVHILWQEVERLESIVQVTHEGLTIKTAFSEVSVLGNGGIIISGQRIHFKSATKSDLWL
jgi:restriction endonuclease S subunit